VRKKREKATERLLYRRRLNWTGLSGRQLITDPTALPRLAHQHATCVELDVDVLTLAAELTRDSAPHHVIPFPPITSRYTGWSNDSTKLWTMKDIHRRRRRGRGGLQGSDTPTIYVGILIISHVEKSNT